MSQISFIMSFPLFGFIFYGLVKGFRVLKRRWPDMNANARRKAIIIGVIIGVTAVVLIVRVVSTPFESIFFLTGFLWWAVIIYGLVKGFRMLKRRWPDMDANARSKVIIIGTVGVLIIGVLTIRWPSAGPSASYLWGEKAGNSSVQMVRRGLSAGMACESMIEAGMAWADNPVLNSDPPPKDFNISDAQKGCLDTVHRHLGY